MMPQGQGGGLETNVRDPIPQEVVRLNDIENNQIRPRNNQVARANQDPARQPAI